uniref:Peptidase metallopeptidase domain-containing protein n=1 Tax=Glossina brevipalpis TaxID=37001 RepID=A0A1A9WVA0_9MUSC
MFTVIFGFTLFYSIICFPAPSRQGIEVPPPEVLRFMRRFGYLDQNPDDSEALYHETAIVQAIRNVQKFGALNQTGQLDQMTLDLFHKPRCGVPDIGAQSFYLTQTSPITRNKRFVFGAGTWTKRHIRYFIGNWSLKVPPAQVERDIARALFVWSQYSGLKFERINDTSADIIIGFGSRYHGDHFPFDGAGNILAHAFYPYEMGSWGGDVHFDEDENWDENSTDLNKGVDFYSVALHELGHSLGLAHSPSHGSIMFPYYKGPGYNVLDYDDTLAMYNAYLSRKLEDDDTEEQNKDEQEDQLNEPVNQSDISTDDEKSSISSSNCDQIENKKYDKDHDNQTTSFIAASTGVCNNYEVPDICLGRFDAVCYFNKSVHIFKGCFAWRLMPNYKISPGYPIAVEKLFNKFPNTIAQIDACYERYDNAVVLFADQQVWIWRNDKFIENSPKPLSVILGNNSFIIPRVNGAMLWPKNNLTYIFGDTIFWRYNDYLQQLDAGYPKTLKRWPGLPHNLNAAATLPNGI